MKRWKGVFLAGLFAVTLTACGSLEGSNFLEPPDLLDQLANADLTAASPQDGAGPQSGYANGSGRGAQKALYPGDDRIGRTTTKAIGVSKSGSSYELNFSDAELSELAKVILTDTLGIPYVFDPRVQGRVTVSTGGPASQTELLSILETVLAMNQAALVTAGNLYRIVPASEARQAGLAIDYQQERNTVGPGYGVSILPLRYASSETMTRLLNSLADKDNVQATVHNNLLIVRGTAQQRNSLLDVAATFDVDWMKGQSAGIFALRNAEPDEVIKELKQVFQVGGQGKGLVRFQAIKRLNGILVLAQKSDLLTKAEEWISRLDHSGSEEKSYYVYRVENGRAKDLAKLLMASVGGTGEGRVREAEESAVAPNEAAVQTGTVAGSEATGGVLQNAQVGMGSATTSSSNADAAEGEEETASDDSTMEQGNGGGVRIVPDERNNNLLIRAPGRELRNILNLLRQIDQPPLQVLINATLAEVTLNDNLRYGVQVYLQKNGGKDGALGFTNGSGLLDSLSGIEISPVVPGMNFIVGAVANPKVVLDALARETAVRVVSSPSVVVTHNQTATLVVGDQVPVQTQQQQSVTAEAPIINSIDYKDTGVSLKVTPRINSNGLVTMDINQEMSAVRGPENLANLTPTISQRAIQSTISVQSGQMVILGGLMGEKVDIGKDRVPVLGDIPYLGDVIGSTSHGKARTELVVFLRPVVIRDPQDASNVAQAVRAGMQSLAPQPAAWDVQVDGRGANGHFASPTK